MKPENSNKPWLLEDLVIVANTLPTAINRKILAKSLGRSEDAIQSQWYFLYCSKSYLRNEDGSINEQYKKTLKAKDIVGLTVSISKNFQVNTKDQEVIKK